MAVMLGITIRRYNDAGHPAWQLLLLPLLVPVGVLFAMIHTREWIGSLILFAIYIYFFWIVPAFPSQPGANRHGPNPKELKVAA